MVLEKALNHDERRQQRSVARGHREAEISLEVVNLDTEVSQDFTANGRLEGLLIELGEINTGGSNLTAIEIFPKDATNDQARILSFSGLILGDELSHYVHITTETMNNVEIYLFGEHNIKLTFDVANQTSTIRVIPILS